MSVSAPLRWLLLATVAVSVFEFFQADPPAPADAAGAKPASALTATAQGAHARNSSNASQGAGVPGAASAPWPLRLPDPHDSQWPRQQVASNYGWEPPAPPPVRPPPKPVLAIAPPVPDGPPPVPAFPYEMVGLLEQDSRISAWLTSSRGTRTVLPEQVLDGRWRVDTIGPRGMTVTWLETGQTFQIKYAP